MTAEETKEAAESTIEAEDRVRLIRDIGKRPAETIPLKTVVIKCFFKSQIQELFLQKKNFFFQ